MRTVYQKTTYYNRMALIPTIFGRDSWWDDFDRPSRIFNQNFGSGLSRDELLNALAVPTSSRNYYRPWRNLLEQSSGVSKIQADKDKYQVIIDVQQFAPNEITVKTIDDSIIVEGKHEEKKDEHGKFFFFFASTKKNFLIILCLIFI